MPVADVKASNYAFLRPARPDRPRAARPSAFRPCCASAIIEGDLAPGRRHRQAGDLRAPRRLALSGVGGAGPPPGGGPRRDPAAAWHARVPASASPMSGRTPSSAARSRPRRCEPLRAAPTKRLLTRLDRNLRHQQAAIAADDRRGFHALDLEFHQILLDALGYRAGQGWRSRPHGRASTASAAFSGRLAVTP